MVLNLERRHDRWRCTRREFLRHGIEPTHVRAVDATKRFAKGLRQSAIMALAELSSRQKTQLLDDDGINIGHLATFLTHLSAIRRIRDGALDFGCIFEDDVTLVDGFKALVHEMYQELPATWDLHRQSCCSPLPSTCSCPSVTSKSTLCVCSSGHEFTV